MTESDLIHYLRPASARLREAIAELRKLRAENARMREALEIIAGMRQCADNLMSSGDVARWALAARPTQEE